MGADLNQHISLGVDIHLQSTSLIEWAVKQHHQTLIYNVFIQVITVQLSHTWWEMSGREAETSLPFFCSIDLCASQFRSSNFFPTYARDITLQAVAILNLHSFQRGVFQHYDQPWLRIFIFQQFGYLPRPLVFIFLVRRCLGCCHVSNPQSKGLLSRWSLQKLLLKLFMEQRSISTISR